MPGDVSEIYHEAVVGELQEERARALGQAGGKVEAEIERCNRLLAEIRSEAGADNPDLRRHYQEARHAAQQRRWEFCVQRECIGLYEHHWVDRIYVIPPPL